METKHWFRNISMMLMMFKLKNYLQLYHSYIGFEQPDDPQRSVMICIQVCKWLITHAVICSTIFIQQIHRTTYFSSAEKTAHVPFLDHQMLEIDCAGREYTNNIIDHDITLKIPEGTVAKGEKIHFEVGVAMYGPFIFPENTQPISPILWLCLLEEDVELKKPFQVILPHYLTGLSEDSMEQHKIRFVKANHSEIT